MLAKRDQDRHDHDDWTSAASHSRLPERQPPMAVAAEVGHKVTHVVCTHGLHERNYAVDLTDRAPSLVERRKPLDGERFTIGVIAC